MHPVRPPLAINAPSGELSLISTESIFRLCQAIITSPNSPEKRVSIRSSAGNWFGHQRLPSTLLLHSAEGALGDALIIVKPADMAKGKSSIDGEEA
jgi:hypothetical protein